MVKINPKLNLIKTNGVVLFLRKHPVYLDANGNTCLTVGIRGTNEYFLLFSDAPRSSENTIYFHHHTGGLCLHSFGLVNSECNNDQRARIQTNANLINNIQVCLSYQKYSEDYSQLTLDVSKPVDERGRVQDPYLTVMIKENKAIKLSNGK